MSSLQGDKELKAAFRELSQLRGSVQRRVVRGATSKALRPLIKAARRRAPENKRISEKTGRRTKAGTLKRALGQRKVKLYPSGVVFGAVGPRAGITSISPTRTNKPTKYAHIPELKYKQHFLEKAFKATEPAMMSIYKHEFRVGLDKEIAKIRAKSGGRR